MSCQSGWNLLGCGGENLTDTSEDPSRSVWQDGSTCRCQDAFGMKCIAWCTLEQIPVLEQTIIQLNQECDSSDRNSVCFSTQNCAGIGSSIMSCNFKGNPNNNITRKIFPHADMFLPVNTCAMFGQRDDEFIMTCMPASNSARPIRVLNFWRNQVVQ